MENTEIVDLLRKVCAQLKIAFSVNDVNQSLADLNPTSVEDPADPGLPPATLLNAVGKQVGIRFRETTSSLRQLIDVVDESTPVLLRQNDPGPKHKSGWLLLLRLKSRSRFVVYFDGIEQVVSVAWLQKNMLRRADGMIDLLLVQPLFAASEVSSLNERHGAHVGPLSPLRRLLALLKPESRDIRTVAIFSLFVGLLSLTMPLAVEALVNTIAFSRSLQPLIMLSLIVFVFLSFSAGLRVLMTVVVEIMQRRLFVRVVDDLSLRLTRVPLTYLKNHHGPELVNRFFDIENVQKMTAKLMLESLLLILQTIIGLLVLAFYHPALLGYDIGLISLMCFALWMLGRGALKTAKQESALKYETAAWLQEIVRHPTTFKFNGGLEFATHRSDELAARYIHSRQDHFQILIRQVAFSTMMQAVAATVLLGLGGWLVIEGQLTLGQLVAAELIVTVILGSLAKIGRDLEGFYDLLASVDKLGKLFDLPGEPANKLQLPPHDGPTRIELVDLKFLESTALKVNASIAAGSSAAVVGRSGSGKTKVIETIAGLHSPIDGYVLINKFRVDLLATESLQSRIGFIKEIEIFVGSVDENLRLGRSDISSTILHDVMEKMGLHETIVKLEAGFQTELSVSGFPLSTSQATRLVLARALIARPPALLIDSLLDRLADEDLIDILSRLRDFEKTTTIVIATGRQVIADWADQQIRT